MTDNSILDQMPNEDALFDLAELFKIFGDSTRIKILFVLMESKMPVNAIAEALNMTQSAVRHLLKARKTERRPPCYQRQLATADN